MTKKKAPQTSLEAATFVLNSLEWCVRLAKEHLPPDYHDDRDALITALDKAVIVAKNVVENESRVRNTD